MYSQNTQCTETENDSLACMTYYRGNRVQIVFLTECTKEAWNHHQSQQDTAIKSFDVPV